MRGAAPGAAPAGWLVALAGLAEDGHLRHIDLHIRFEGIQLHEAVAVAVGQRNVSGRLRAGHRVKRVHNGL